MTCDSCKWWDSKPDGKEPITHECNSSKLGHFAEGNDALVSHDAEGYSSYVSTGPKFGCIHHEPKQ